MASKQTDAEEKLNQAIHVLIDAQDFDDQKGALESLVKTCAHLNKKIVVAVLAEQLNTTDRANATWLISAIGQVGDQSAVEILKQYTTDDQPSERIRYRAVLALANLLIDDDPQTLKSEIERILKSEVKKAESADESGSVRIIAACHRILMQISEPGNKDFTTHQEALRELADGRVHERLSAMRALRAEVCPHPLPIQVERDFIDVVERRLMDSNEWRDVRQQAAMVLGDMVYFREDATHALNQMLKRNAPKPVMYQCIDALAQLNCLDLAKESAEEKRRLHDEQHQRELVDTFFYGLRNPDPTIIFRTIDAIEQTLEKEVVLQALVDDVLRSEPPVPAGYLHAMRQIDHRMAAEMLANNLLNPDQKVSERAYSALADLGGAEALRSLEAKRNMLDRYTKMLSRADHQAMLQFGHLMRHAKIAFRISMTMHSLFFLMGVALFVAGLVAAFRGMVTAENLFAVLGTTAVGALMTWSTLFYKDPIKHIGRSVDRLVKVNVVFLGYIRQINQIDATFKQMFLDPTRFGLQQMERTVGSIESAVAQTLQIVDQYLDEDLLEQNDEKLELDNLAHAVGLGRKKSSG